METKLKSITAVPFAKFSDSVKVTNLKAITFDCYGTLLNCRTTVTPAEHPVWLTLSNYITYHTGIRYTPKELCDKFFVSKDLERKANLELAKGEPFEIDEIHVYHRLMPGVDDQILQTAAEIFRASTTVKLELYPGVKEFLLAAKESGLRIFMTSNAQVVYTSPEFKGLGIYDLFDGDMERGISSDTFFAKSSRKFFQTVLDRLGVEPHEVLNVGNYKPDDIDPPHALGMRTCLLNSERQECNVPDDNCDFFLDYPLEESAPLEQYPFVRLKKYFFG